MLRACTVHLTKLQGSSVQGAGVRMVLGCTAAVDVSAGSVTVSAFNRGAVVL
jgi:hypothetical protein